VFAPAILLAASLIWPATVVAQTVAGAPCGLEAKLPHWQVSGRIDHFSID
jgi:hypothetical protein